jgi:hypothetical protein
MFSEPTADNHLTALPTEQHTCHTQPVLIPEKDVAADTKPRQ